MSTKSRKPATRRKSRWKEFLLVASMKNASPAGWVDRLREWATPKGERRADCVGASQISRREFK